MKAYYTPGRYWGRIIDQALGESKEKQTPQFVLRFLILGKIDPADPDGDLIAVEKYERTAFMYITDKTIEFVMRDLDRLGFEGNSFRLLDPNTPGFTDFRNKEAAFLCQHEEYKGEAKEKWSIARESAGLAVQPLDAKGIRTLDDLFGKQLKTLKKANGAPPLTQETVATETAVAIRGGDDIPF